MADKKKPTKDDIQNPEEIADAVIVEDDESPAEEVDDAPDEDGGDTRAIDDEPLIAEAGDDTPISADETQDNTWDDPDTGDTVAAVDADDTVASDEPGEASEPVETPLPPAPQPEPVVIKKGGFFPMLLGGIAAAVIGFGAARYVLPEGWPWPGTSDDALATEMAEANAAQDSRIEELAGQVATLAKGPDLSGIEATVSGNSDTLAQMSGRLDAMQDTLTTLETRLTDLEKRPIAEGASDAAVAAYERDLQQMREAMATQRAEIEDMIAAAQQKEQDAEMTAREAMIRAALSRVQTALDTGGGFAPALADLEAAGVAIPVALSDVSEGAPTMADLMAAFPDAARDALTASRKAEGETGSVGGFLRTQLGIRSLEPQEGDSPDAVLSRAEAALRDGHLTDALAEIETLPEAGRAALSDWSAMAQTRQNAVAAAEAVGQSLTAN